MVAQLPLGMAAQQSPDSIRGVIDTFLADTGELMLCEPGEEMVRLTPESFALEQRNGALVLQAWDERRNLVRRVVAIESQTRARLTLRVERFGKKTGSLALVDLRRSDNRAVERRSAKLEFREVFRRFLLREFPGFQLPELSTEADLEHSLSPSYPRALLRQGTTAWAAMGAAPNGAPVDGILTFGLIWLDYLRSREKAFTIQGLLLFLPAGAEKTTCLRLLFLDPAVAQYSVYIYSAESNGCNHGGCNHGGCNHGGCNTGSAGKVDLNDYGNLNTKLERCRRRLPSPVDQRVARLQHIQEVESVEKPDGSLSLRVHGIEFARTQGDQLLGGLETKRVIPASNQAEIENLAAGLARLRSVAAPDHLNPLYLREREAWIESRVRAGIESIDASLALEPIYGQVPAFAAAERGVIDLLATDRSGRLAILELKASEDIHLPLQALDYWIRVKWHLDRNEFEAFGYFPGRTIQRDVPRLLLVAPALSFHPSIGTILRFFSPAIPVERLGIGVEWQTNLKVVFRS